MFVLIINHFTSGYRAQQFIKAVLDDTPANPQHVEEFHNHVLRICVSSLSHQDASVAHAMNHSEAQAKRYQRTQGSGVMKLQGFMEGKVALPGKSIKPSFTWPEVKLPNLTHSYIRNQQSRQETGAGGGGGTGPVKEPET